MPERFWNAFSESLGAQAAVDNLRKRAPDLNWDCNLRYTDPESRSHVQMEQLEKEDNEILRAVIAAALVVEPAKRAPAREMLRIMREGWAVVTDPDVLDLDQSGVTWKDHFASRSGTKSIDGENDTRRFHQLKESRSPKYNFAVPILDLSNSCGFSRER